MDIERFSGVGMGEGGVVRIVDGCVGREGLVDVFIVFVVLLEIVVELDLGSRRVVWLCFCFGDSRGCGWR